MVEVFLVFGSIRKLVCIGRHRGGEAIGIYNRAALLEAIENGEVFEYVLFYGHKASTDGSVTASCCSQWFPAPFTIDGVEYLAAEHYMMAAKARLFNDSEMLENILGCQTPKEAKAFAEWLVATAPKVLVEASLWCKSLVEALSAQSRILCQLGDPVCFCHISYGNQKHVRIRIFERST